MLLKRRFCKIRGLSLGGSRFRSLFLANEISAARNKTNPLT